MDWTRPNNQKELRQFNGMVNYISQFMPHAATITAPLTELTGDAEWLWTDLQETASQAVKRAAEDHQVLRPIDYDNSDMIWLFTDASPTGTGAWIGQGPARNAARSASFHSRKLTPAQSNYPTHQQETHAIVEAMELFAHLLLLRHFTVVTDHESLTKLMTQKNLNRRQQRWLTHIGKYDYEIEYQPGANNFLADYLSRIHEVVSGPQDITLKDPTLDEKEPTPSARSLSIHTHYTSSREYSAESENAMTQTNHSPTLTSRECIYSTSPDYLMNEISSHAVTRSQKRKIPPQSNPSVTSNDNPISIGNNWGYTVTLPIPSEIQRRHSAMSWPSCTDDDCEDSKEDEIGARYWPKNPKKHKQSKRARGKKRTDFGPTLSNEKCPTALRDIPLLSEYAPPIPMQENIIDTPPMASPAFELLYSEPYLSPCKAERAQSFIGTLHPTLMGDFRPRVLKALELNPLYVRVKQTGKKLHYSIDGGLFMAQNTNGPTTFTYR